MAESQNENHRNSNEAVKSYAKLVVALYAVYRVLDARKRAYKAFLHLLGYDNQDKA